MTPYKSGLLHGFGQDFALAILIYASYQLGKYAEAEKTIERDRTIISIMDMVSDEKSDKK